MKSFISMTYDFMIRGYTLYTPWLIGFRSGIDMTVVMRLHKLCQRVDSFYQSDVSRRVIRTDHSSLYESFDLKQRLVRARDALWLFRQLDRQRRIPPSGLVVSPGYVFDEHRGDLRRDTLGTLDWTCRNTIELENRARTPRTPPFVGTMRATSPARARGRQGATKLL